MSFESLFKPIQINKTEIKNRIAMAPMGNLGMVDKDNAFTSRGIEYFVERARGGTGLIITGYMEVENEIEKSGDGITLNPNTDPYRFGLTAGELTERVHAYGTKIFAQLAMGYGRVGYPQWLKKPPVAPSPIPCYWDPTVTARELKTEEVEELVRQMARAARVVKESGFDGIEVHAAHEGYLIDQFMIAFFNRRTDRYGGSFENRMRLPREVLDAIRTEVGPDFPVIMRFSVKSFIKDWGKGGLPGEVFEEKGRDIKEAQIVAKELEKMGYDALDADCGSYEGWYWAHPPGYMEHGLYLPYVKRLKEVVSIPVMMAGRMDVPELASRAVRSGEIDMVVLGRGLLADPQWPEKVRTGRPEAIRPCLGCHDGCLAREDAGRPVSCGVNPGCGREAEYALTPALKPKQVMIAGGGIAGMEAARAAALRGHRVVLHEAKAFLGGHIIEASVPPFKEDERKLLEWYKRELQEQGVEIRLNSQVDRSLIEKEQPQEVIIATGSTERKIRIEGADLDAVLSASDLLLYPEKAGDRILIIGGGLVGCELALWLKEQGKKAAIVECMDALMGTVFISHANKQMLLDMLSLEQVPVHTGSFVRSWDGHQASITGPQGISLEIEADTLVSAIGYQPEQALYAALRDLPFRTHIIGDARAVANIQYAIWDAYEVARTM